MGRDVLACPDWYMGGEKEGWEWWDDGPQKGPAEGKRVRGRYRSDDSQNRYSFSE
jgi:hypothetical protein